MYACNWVISALIVYLHSMFIFLYKEVMRIIFTHLTSSLFVTHLNATKKEDSAIINAGDVCFSKSLQTSSHFGK